MLGSDGSYFPAADRELILGLFTLLDRVVPED
jgi:hypothetical protein